MKNIYSFAMILLVSISFGQGKKSSFDELVESEMKAAAKFANITVNPNTQNYDVTYHKLEIAVNPSVYSLSAKVTTTFKALSDMSTVTFDFSKITNTSDPNYANRILVSSVKQNGADLIFSHTDSNELVINLSSTLTTGNQTSVEITYAGAPANSGFGSFVQTQHNNANIIWTLSEPFGAMDWWPCKQDLNDKIESTDVYIKAPSQFTSVSNGIEPDPPVTTGLFKTFHFHHGYPIPAYLVCFAVTNYSIVNQIGGTAPNTYPIKNYIYPEDLPFVQGQLAQTPLILNLFENLFEVYPFHNEKYGHAQFGWGGGMEHTTVSFMVNFDRQLIAHEMAHQWFGDKITCGTWKDIWLNEGFATYVAALVIENFDGQDAFTAEKSSMIDYITQSPTGAVYLTETEATNVNRIFSSRLSYDKGAMVLNMLRFKLGDVLFFQGIKNYLADPNLAYNYAITTNLQTHLEAVYGSSLQEFFNDWVYKQGYPSYAITAQNVAAGQVKFTINQTQSNSSVSFFEMPLPVRVFGANNQQLDLVLNNTFNGEIILQNVPFVVTSLTFDPNKNIISKNNAVVLNVKNIELETLKLFPNPSSNTLKLSLPNEVILEKATFYNSIGQIVKSSKNETTWNVNDLSNGIYLLDLETNYGVKQLKFIKN